VRGAKASRGNTEIVESPEKKCPRLDENSNCSNRPGEEMADEEKKGGSANEGFFEPKRKALHRLNLKKEVVRANERERRRKFLLLGNGWPGIPLGNEQISSARRGDICLSGNR